MKRIHALASQLSRFSAFQLPGFGCELRGRAFFYCGLQIADCRLKRRSAQGLMRLIGIIAFVGFAYELKNSRTYQLTNFPAFRFPSFTVSKPMKYHLCTINYQLSTIN